MTPSKLYKYPRTYHIPDSLGVSSDDKMLKDYSIFEGREVVVTEKMDGEATSIYQNYIHARSLDSRHHCSRDWVKTLASSVGWQLPEDWRICGENVYAKHSIKYVNLSTYFYVYSIWNADNQCLSWDDTVDYCKLLELTHVPVLYRGIFNKKLILDIPNHFDSDHFEGFVIRNAEPFKYADFSKNIGKFVRANHVNPDSKHWFNSVIEKNELQTEQ